MNAVKVDDALILTVEEVHQEEELLIMLWWQWFNVLFQVINVLYRLLLHLLVRYCLVVVL
jgi:hypothetical protein